MTAAAQTGSTTAAALPVNWPRRIGYIALAVYAVYAASTLVITWDRIVRGLPQGARFLSRMWPPNFEASKLDLMRAGLVESIEIAVLALHVAAEGV